MYVSYTGDILSLPQKHPISGEMFGSFYMKNFPINKNVKNAYYF